MIKKIISQVYMENLGVFIADNITSNIVVYPSDNSILFGNCHGFVKRFLNGKEIDSIKVCENENVLSIAVYDAFLVSGSADASICVMNMITKETQKIKIHQQAINSVALNNNYMVSASDDGTCKIFKNFKFVEVLVDSIYPMKKVEINNNNVIMCYGADNSVHSWQY